MVVLKTPSLRQMHHFYQIFYKLKLLAWFKFDQKWVSQSNQEPAHI
jgi:hypothetical protein